MQTSPASNHRLRLVTPLAPNPRGTWLARAERDARGFILRHGHSLSDPSLAAWVVEECAELAWEVATPEERGTWNGLRIAELWLRLASMHRFFPQPRLVVAYYETLRAFLPWLVVQGRLTREHGVRMFDELDRVGTPMLERARQQLAERHPGRQSRK